MAASSGSCCVIYPNQISTCYCITGMFEDCEPGANVCNFTVHAPYDYAFIELFFISVISYHARDSGPPAEFPARALPGLPQSG